VLANAAGAVGLGGATPAYAHGINTLPWIYDLASGALRPVLAGPFDDSVGLAWAAGDRQLMLLDAQGLLLIPIDGGQRRVATFQAGGLAWRDA
jgi:hypothetical protein